MPTLDSEPDARAPAGARAGDAAHAGGAATRARGGERGRSLAILALLLLLAVLPIGRALVDPERVALAVDTATTQLPWSAAIAAEVGGDGAAVARPRNPALSDQGVGFYPFYRWVVASWRSGDAPFWNPLLYLGAPGLGNPQYGVLDPQVLVLVPLEAAFGIDGFHLGLAWLAALRLAAAGIGTYLLARRLGLGRAGALLAAIAFQHAGYVQLWLNFSLGHVTPFLPWLLLALEGCRGERRGFAALGAAVCTAGAVLGGHPETAFYVGAAAAVWALAILRDDRRAGTFALLGMLAGGLVAFPSVLPFLEYLARSGAHELRQQMAVERRIDLVALGALIALAAAARIHARSVDVAAVRSRLLRLAPLALAVLAFAVATLLARRGLPDTAGLALVHDLFGHPARPGGYFGPGTHVEEASAWVPSAALVLALASALSGRGRLARRRLVLALGFVSFALALRAPGLLELKLQLPVVGLGATVRLAAVSALMLALAAGDALESAGPLARRAAVLVALALGLGWCRPADVAALPADVAVAAEQDELVRFALAPASSGRGAELGYEAWVHPSVPFARAGTRLTRIGVEDAGDGNVRESFDVPAELVERPSPRARTEGADAVAAAPDGARWVANRFVDTSRLAPGHWRVELELLAADGDVLGSRRAGVVTIARPTGAAWSTWLLAALGAVLVVAGAPARRGAVAAALVAVAALDGLAFARGLNPSVPAAEAFPETRTERWLAGELGAHRYFSDSGVLPPDTGLVRGLRALDGYDGLDVATYNAYRPFALQRGVHPLLGWSARGADLDAPLYRVLGVRALVLAAPLSHPRFELVAAPDGSAPEHAETFLYRDREPFPRAFVATELVTQDEAWSHLVAGTFDVPRMAAYDGAWRPRAPATSWRVTAGPHVTNRRVSVTVELDGDGLLVVTEQAFPGWIATVGGERRSLGVANGVFRALPLEAGRHEVVLEYRPRSFAFGLGAAAIGAALALALVVAGRRAGREATRAEAPAGA